MTEPKAAVGIRDLITRDLHPNRHGADGGGGNRGSFFTAVTTQVSVSPHL
jgi:hypothetical protein